MEFGKLKLQGISSKQESDYDEEYGEAGEEEEQDYWLNFSIQLNKLKTEFKKFVSAKTSSANLVLNCSN